MGKGKDRTSTMKMILKTGAYGPSRPMSAEERSQFGLQNREWLLRWLSSLMPEERVQVLRPHITGSVRHHPLGNPGRA